MSTLAWTDVASQQFEAVYTKRVKAKGVSSASVRSTSEIKQGINLFSVSHPIWRLSLILMGLL